MLRPAAGIRARGDERRKLGLKGGSGRVTGKRIRDGKGGKVRLCTGRDENRDKQGKREDRGE